MVSEAPEDHRKLLEVRKPSRVSCAFAAVLEAGDKPHLRLLQFFAMTRQCRESSWRFVFKIAK